MSQSAARRVVPIACTLTADEQPTRLAEWRDFAATSVESVTHDNATLSLMLAPTDVALLTAIDLAEREQQCCAFFEFSLTLDAGRRVLQVSAPDDAQAVLTGFYEVLTGT